MKKLLLVACLGAALCSMAYAGDPGQIGGAPTVAHAGLWSQILSIWLGLVL